MVLPSRVDDDGFFPFGMPNGPRDLTWKGSGAPRLVVVGVYPSALHVSWKAPAHVARPEGGAGRVSAMAVDVEPEVFWTGDGADGLVERWKDSVGFVEGDEAGCDGYASARGNGPSGRTLLGYLEALGVAPEETAFLDVYPVFVVHRSSGSQGRAVARDYDPVASSLGPSGREPSTLPTRPSAKVLPRQAADRFGGWLRESLAELRPDIVITLGQESWDALAQVDGIALANGHSSLADSKQHYGEPGGIDVASTTITWFPLVHPGLLSKNAEWKRIHEQWQPAR